MEIAAGDAFRYAPGTVHRVTAIEDTTILEVSTPHLDDVVRIEDRYGAPRGRERSEACTRPPRTARARAGAHRHGSRTTRSSCSTSGGSRDEEVELRCHDAAELAEAIRTLAVRGAPAIGVAAAYGMALAATRGEDVDAAYETLAPSRPTAVNLRWALDEMRADPTRGAGAADPRRRGRALPARWARTAPTLVPPGARDPHALQRRRPRDRRLRDGRRRDPRGLGARAASSTSGSTRRGRCSRARG